MKVGQQCAGCQSRYSLSQVQYVDLRLAYCPACGHPNAKRPVIPAKNYRVAKVIVGSQGARTNFAGSQVSTRNRAGVREVYQDRPQPLEKLRWKIEDKARVFILGDDPSLLNYDLSYLKEYNFPTLGLGGSFRRFLADAFFFRENISWINHNSKRLMALGRSRKELYFFYPKLSNEKIPFERAGNFQQYTPNSEMIWDLEIPLSLQAGSVLPAINLAYLFGALEIFLLGVEEDEEIFQVVDTLDGLCRIASCWEGTKAPYQQYEGVCGEGVPAYLSKLFNKIQKTGKCFLLGTGPSLQVSDLSRLFGFPVFGTNSAFQKFPFLDALIFGDTYFIEKYQNELEAWQAMREEKPVIFWQNYGGGGSLQRIFRYNKGQPSRVIYESPLFVNPFFSLKHSVITCAINCAYWLGAREIYLLGVEISGGHFFDEDGKIFDSLGKVHDHFPHAGKVADHLQKQQEYLADKGVALATCYQGGVLEGKIPFIPLEEAADSRFLTHLGGQNEFKNSTNSL